MASLSTWLWGTSQLDDAIDKATSELLPAGSEDIALNLEICDQIRSKSVPAKDAMRALKRRLGHKNPNVQLLALGLTDICVKNGGDLFLNEVASREFMDNLVSILKIPALNLEVKNAILRHLQNWSVAFEGKPSLSYVGQVYKTLVNEGYKFPPKDLAVANAAMVDTQTAPEWIDSDVCLRCRTPFTFTNRKHHCRNCGQVFDQACSSKTMPLPHFGITQEVRVCDGCHAKLTKKALQQQQQADKSHGNGHGNGHGHRHSSSRHRSARGMEDAELQRAIELSLQEVNANSGRPGYVPSQPPSSSYPYQYSEPPIIDHGTRPSAAVDDEDDPDLRAAIEASLREANAPKPSAPVVVETPRSEQPPSSYSYEYASQSVPSSQPYPTYTSQQPAPTPPVLPALPKIPNYDLEPLEEDAILTFSQTVEQVQAQGGRDMSRYPAVTELYDKANGLRPKLAISLDDASRKEQMLSEMHEKLSEAVKLYDQLLTQQIAHPRWRSLQPQPVPGPSYHPVTTHATGYGQWAPPPQSPQTSYASAIPASQPQWQQQPLQQPLAAPSSPPQQIQQTITPTPMTIPTSQAATTTISTPAPAPASIPSSYVPQAQSPPLAPPPVSYQPYANVTSPPPPQDLASKFATTATPSSPSTLSRHNTISYAPSTPVHSGLARSNTVSLQGQRSQQPPQSQAQTYQQPNQQQSYILQPPPPQQQQHQQSYTPQPYVPVQQPPAQAQPQLSQFPVVPTSPPTSFPLYGSSIPAIPSGVAQTEERKEALLIDL